MKKFCYTRGVNKINCEKSMKKLPFLLSNLTLCGLGVVYVSSFLTPEVLALGDMNYTLTNPIDSMFSVNYVRPDYGLIEVGARTGQAGKALRQMVAVMYNYEDGVTEAEADEKMLDLGVGDVSEWATVLGTYVTETPSWKREFLLSTEMNFAEENKTDLFYFAAEYGDYREENGEIVWSNLYWKRGKIDYRNCIHGEQYEVGDYCRPVENSDGVTTTYWPYARTYEMTRPVITWDEEWREIQAGRVREVKEEVDELTELFERDMDEGRFKLAEKETGIREVLTKLKTTLTALDDITERSRLMKERAEVEWALDELLVKVGERNQEGDDQDWGNSLNLSSTLIVNDSLNFWETLSHDEGSNAVWDGSVGVTKIVAEEQGTNEVGGDESVAMGLDLLDNDAEGVVNEGTEVPNLGEGKSGFNLWVILLPLIAGMITLVWLWVRRVSTGDEE